MSASKNDIIEEVKKYGGYFMAYKVNFKDVETVGLETSPVADSLAGLRANEARYFWNKYKFEYLTYPAHEKADEVALFEKILLEERNLKFSAKILEVAIYEKVGQEGKKPKWAVGIKLSVGMEIPKELEGKFKFARQRSKLAGEIRGSYFTIKQEWL